MGKALRIVFAMGWGRAAAQAVGKGLTALALCQLGACDLPASGPTASEVTAASKPARNGETRFALVDVDPAIVDKMAGWKAVSMQGTFGRQGPVSSQAIGVGDFVQIVIWEAAAGGLFSAPSNDRVGSGSRSAIIPEQVVGPDGAVTVPYAGRVPVVGRSPQQVEAAIVQALTGKAIEPQALVTITKNVSNTVTVVGEVTGGARVPITTRGDRILDVVAQAGGTRAPAHETFITLVRGGTSVRIPMQAMLTDPAENVYVRPGDVVSRKPSRRPVRPVKIWWFPLMGLESPSIKPSPARGASTTTGPMPPAFTLSATSSPWTTTSWASGDRMSVLFLRFQSSTGSTCATQMAFSSPVAFPSATRTLSSLPTPRR